MNWYKKKIVIAVGYNIIDYLKTVPLEGLEKGVLPKGFDVRQDDDGKWTCYGPNDYVLVWKEPTFEAAQKMALTRLKFVVKPKSVLDS